jgi:hypothetical protein
MLFFGMNLSKFRISVIKTKNSSELQDNSPDLLSKYDKSLIN